MTDRRFVVFLSILLSLTVVILASCADSDRAQQHVEESLRLNQEGYYNRALEEANKAIEINPGLAEAYNSRAWAYGQRGQWDLTIDDATKAIQLDDGLAMAYINRGWAYTNKKEWDLAIADYTRALELDPDNATLYADRAMAYRGKSAKDEAIADLKQFIRLTDNPQGKQIAERLIDELSE